MTDRVDITEVDVVGYLLTRLRSQLGLNERSCWYTLDPLAVDIPPGGDFYVTVAPGNSQFPDGEQASRNITEESTVQVTVYSRMRLDSTNHDDKLVLDAANSLYKLKKRVLAAIVGHDLTDEDADYFLRQWLHVLSSDRPNYDKDKAVGWLTLHVGVSFDWDLT